jgi:hypothetical protein
MNPLRAATLSVTDLAAALDRYGRWLDYRPVAVEPLPAEVALAAGAPASAGCPSAVLQPASGRAVYLRLVERPPVAGYVAMRSHGWTALEICVADVHATHAALRGSPFAIVGPPAAIAGLPTIHPMQVQGPDGELIFLTEIKAGGPGSGLPDAQAPIDTLFICVMGCRDMPAMAAWAGAQLGATVAPEVSIPYRTVSRAFDLPADTRHRITTATRDDAIFLEFDQYPDVATARPGRRGCLVPGVSIVTVTHDVAAVPGPWLAPPAARGGVIYRGRRVGVLRSPEGALLEVVDRE